MYIGPKGMEGNLVIISASNNDLGRRYDRLSKYPGTHSTIIVVRSLDYLPGTVPIIAEFDGGAPSNVFQQKRTNPKRPTVFVYWKAIFSPIRFACCTDYYSCYYLS